MIFDIQYTFYISSLPPFLRVKGPKVWISAPGTSWYTEAVMRRMILMSNVAARILVILRDRIASWRIISSQQDVFFEKNTHVI